MPSTSPQRLYNQEQSTFSTLRILELILRTRCTSVGTPDMEPGLRIIGRAVVEECRAFDGENTEKYAVHACAACPMYELPVLDKRLFYAKHYMLKYDVTKPKPLCTPSLLMVQMRTL